MKLRQANNNDYDLVKNLIYKILEEYGLKSDPQSTDKDIADIESNYANRNGYFGILENDTGVAVATVGIYNINSTTCELRKMYLTKDERGKGYGKFLLESALNKSKELGYKKVILETASVLKEAIGLYKKYGFVQYFPDHLSNRCDQAFYLNI